MLAQNVLNRVLSKAILVLKLRNIREAIVRIHLNSGGGGSLPRAYSVAFICAGAG